MATSSNTGCLDNEDLVALTEQKLSPDDKQRIDRHIDDCEVCRALLADLLRAIGPTSPSPPGQAPVVDELSAGARFSRYEILDRLGAGGMGVVYLARDPELDRKLAIKVLRRDLGLPSDEARQAVLREAQAMARLSSRRVVTIHDVGSVGEQVFIAMEYVEGVTLRAWLSARTRSWREVVDVFIAAGRGLAVAHAAGLVHRDFKPDNVIVTPQGRVCVTDFGLARLVGDAPSSGPGSPPPALVTTLVRTGKVVGTPRYMAPEQIDGQPTDARADEFSFAVALYEALYRQRPFAGETMAEVRRAMQRGEIRAAPSGTAEPRALARALTRALAEDPESRYPSLSQLLTALERATQSPRRARATAAALVAVAVVGGASTWLALRPARDPPSSPRATSARRGVAVLGFRDLSSSRTTGWLAIALQQMLSTELGSGEQLRVSEGERVARARLDLQLPDADRFSSETLARVRRRLDVNLVVDGSYVVTGNQVRLDLAVQDTSSGDTVAMFALPGDTTRPFDLATRAGAALRTSLGVDAAPASVTKSHAAQPSDGEATRLYAEALARRVASDLVGARDRLERALAREPGFVLARSALSGVYLELGDHRRARAQAEAAFNAASDLPRAERLVLEARLRQLDQQWDRAVELYRALFTFFPDELDYGVALARAQTLGGHAPEAIHTIDELHRLPPPLGDDPRVDLQEQLAWGKQGNWDKRLQAAERAIKKARATGATLLVADGENNAAEAHFYRGEVAEARQLYDDAQRIYRAAGERENVMRTVVGLGELDDQQGNFDAALRAYRQAVDFYREMGNEEQLATKLNRVAQALYRKGDFAGAKTVYADSLLHERNVGEREGIANVLVNMANISLDEGDVVAAEKNYREALALFRQIGMRHHEAVALDFIGATLRLQGKLDEAARLTDESIAILRQVGDHNFLMEALIDRAAIWRDADRLADARRALVEAQALADKADVHGSAGQARLALAENSFDAGDLAAADTATHALLDALAPEERGLAQALRARILLARGQAGALELADAAFASEGKATQLDHRFAVTIAAAIVRARLGHCGGVGVIDPLATLAHDKHLVAWELDLELVCGEIERACGDDGRARARLQALAIRAGKGGLARVARIARAGAN